MLMLKSTHIKILEEESKVLLKQIDNITHLRELLQQAMEAYKSLRKTNDTLEDDLLVLSNKIAEVAIKGNEQRSQLLAEVSRLNNKLTAQELINQMQYDLLQVHCPVGPLQQLANLQIKTRRKYGVNDKIVVADDEFPQMQLDDFIGGAIVPQEDKEMSFADTAESIEEGLEYYKNVEVSDPEVEKLLQEVDDSLDYKDIVYRFNKAREGNN